MSKKKATDEQIAAALLTCGTSQSAAVKLGISAETIYKRMSSAEFIAIYEAAKADLLRLAVAGVATNLADAIDTTAAIMKDADATPATRLQAAQVIINSAVKLTDKLAEREAAQVQKNRIANDPMLSFTWAQQNIVDDMDEDDS